VASECQECGANSRESHVNFELRFGGGLKPFVSSFLKAYAKTTLEEVGVRGYR
jgi:hypothetical protein